MENPVVNILKVAEMEDGSYHFVRIHLCTVNLNKILAESSIIDEKQKEIIDWINDNLHNTVYYDHTVNFVDKGTKTSMSNSLTEASFWFKDATDAMAFKMRFK